MAMHKFKRLPWQDCGCKARVYELELTARNTRLCPACGTEWVTMGKEPDDMPPTALSYRGWRLWPKGHRGWLARRFGDRLDAPSMKQMGLLIDAHSASTPPYGH